MVRNSNIELLRLICMFLILVHHILVRVYTVPLILLGEGNIGWSESLAIILNSLCYIGVNCFFLISGYFGLKFKWRGLFNLYFIMFFYALLQTITDSYIFNTSITIGELKEVVLPFTHFGEKHWWFMTTYLLLYTMSPIISMNNLTKRDYIILILVLSYVNVYFGYWAQGKEIGNGYSLIQFIYMYVIGGYISKHFNLEKLSKRLCFASYFVSCLLFALLSIASHFYEISHWNAFAYNNPFLVIASISFFLFIIKFDFKSRVINSIALSSLAIYLFQNENLNIMSDYIAPYKSNLLLFPLLCFCEAAIFFVIAVGIDRVRLYLYNVLKNKMDIAMSRH